DIDAPHDSSANENSYIAPKVLDVPADVKSDIVDKIVDPLVNLDRQL
ncbi:hypothetical protein L195_g017193, partial [Trifolium pratense]